MAYQTFPWQQGDSDSYNKLLGLDIPNLKGKTLLDVGCNTGFFCGYAAFLGAKKVVGLDNNQQFIDLAKAIFPQCEFICASWNDLGDEKYDVILNLSAIHYAEDQKKFLDFLMAHLNPGGLLILEIGVAAGEEDKFVEVRRSIDSRFFPTQKKLESMFDGYATKLISRSVPQAGDPVPRWVYHIRKKLPIAILLMDDPHAGKTFVSNQIFRKDILKISGDKLYFQVHDGNRQAPPEIKAILKRKKSIQDCSWATMQICISKLLPQLCDMIAREAGQNDFVLDMYIPQAARMTMRVLMEKRGYYVADLQLQKACSHPRINEKAFTGSCSNYMEYLQHEYMIDEAAYLEANPDVAQALAEKRIISAFAHYLFCGRKEGRPRSLHEEKK